MLFYLHYILLTSGLSGTSVLLAVYFKTYSDASQGETGALLMAIPFVSLFIKPIFCSMADRRQAHRPFMMLSLVVMMLGFAPFVVIPFFPQFYTHYQRASWYLLVVSCLIGASGLGVAWSLGDCLAMNYGQRTGTPFGRMRLMGTLSWGIYGFIIGQINEHPALPKYVPAFIILHASVLAELLMLAFWDKSAFEMVDPLMGDRQELAASALDLANCEKGVQKQNQLQFAPTLDSGGGGSWKLRDRLSHDEHLHGELESIHVRRRQRDNLVDSVSSSLGGTLKINPKMAKTLFDVLSISNDDEELVRRLAVLEQQQQATDGLSNGNNNNDLSTVQHTNNNMPSVIGLDTNSLKKQDSLQRQLELVNGHHQRPPQEAAAQNGGNKNPQMILLKLIIMCDGRVIKYLVVFTLFGALMAPVNFFFVSMEEHCRERGYNFSQLAGAVLMSQALIETVAFLVVPYLLLYVSRWSMLSFGLAIMAVKYVFYAGWFYDDDVSPYWAVLSEWSHGIPYGIFCTIMADVSLVFASQSQLFVPELRRLGYLRAEPTNASKEELEAEERSIKLALRATMQALFSGFMDGLGMGSGALLCGLISDLYSYHIVWLIFATLTAATFAMHLFAEITRSRLSDTYKPKEGTKAFEIMEMTRACDEAQRTRMTEARQNKLATATGSKQVPIKMDTIQEQAPPM